MVTASKAEPPGGEVPHINQPNSNRKTPLAGGLQDPVAVERERRNAGQSAAAGAAVRPRRPTDDAADGRPARPILEHRPAGIAGTGAKSVANPLRGRIDQANLQC